LLVFSSQVDPPCIEGDGDAAEGSSSLSIGELWPDIDKLDEVNHGATFMGDLPRNMLREWSSSTLVARVNERENPMSKRTLVDDAPEPSSTPPRGRGHGRGSMRKKGRIDFGRCPQSYLAPHAEVVCG
jgi:hypothetical protein